MENTISKPIRLRLFGVPVLFTFDRALGWFSQFEGQNKQPWSGSNPTDLPTAGAQYGWRAF